MPGASNSPGALEPLRFSVSLGALGHFLRPADCIKSRDHVIIREEEGEEEMRRSKEILLL